jgi:uncharacterized protein YybS (DUF2232 family)
MQKNMLIAVGSGGLSAVASLAFLSGMPGGLLFVYLATLPIFIVAFSMGSTAASVAAVSGIVMAGLVGGALTAAAFGLFHALPAWFVSRQSLSVQKSLDRNNDESLVWYPVGSVLSILTLLCAALMVIGALAFTSNSVDTIEQSIAQSLFETFAIMMPNQGDAEMLAMVDTLASIFPGAMGGSWVLMTVVNAVLAQNIVTRMGRNIRPTPRFMHMELPHWAAWPLIITAVMALIMSGEARYMAQNVTMILATPFFFLGLSVIHWAVRRISFSTALLTVFYLIMIVSGWALMLVAALGMIEQWAGVRSRFNDKTNNDLTNSENSDTNGHNGPKC